MIINVISLAPSDWFLNLRPFNHLPQILTIELQCNCLLLLNKPLLIRCFRVTSKSCSLDMLYFIWEFVFIAVVIFFLCDGWGLALYRNKGGCLRAWKVMLLFKGLPRRKCFKLNSCAFIYIYIETSKEIPTLALLESWMLVIVGGWQVSSS